MEDKISKPEADAFLAELRQLTNRYELVLIGDELHRGIGYYKYCVQSGVGDKPTHVKATLIPLGNIVKDYRQGG